MKNKKFLFSILGFLVISNLIAWLVVFDLAKTQFLEVNFFDVGQGDAIFIETPSRQQILIDGGPSSVILEKLSKEMPFWDRNIDLIILTHPEYDHLSGLNEVLRKYRVQNILWTGIVRDTAEYKEWLKLIHEDSNPPTALPRLTRAPKAKISIAMSEKKIIMSPGLVMNILYPLENLEGKEFEDSNNTSIVSKLVFGKNSFLFTGDAYKDVEGELLLNQVKQQLDSDILKVAHHGSKTSTSEEFLKEVSPEIAVISVGRENKYGHPHPEVLENLAKYGIKVLRTDLNGDIKIISDGKKYAISNF